MGQGKAQDEQRPTLGTRLDLRGRSLFDTHRLQPRVPQMHFFQNVVGEHRLALMEQLLLAKPVKPKPAPLPLQECPPTAHGIAFPTQGDLVFLVTRSQSHAGNAS